MKRKDPRPICNCSAYPFPHKIGGKCKGIDFAEFFFYQGGEREVCNQCNCLNGDKCDVVEGLESINEAECYRERLKYNPSEHLPLELDLDYEGVPDDYHD